MLKTDINFAKFRISLNDALVDLCKEYNMLVTQGGIRYDDDSLDIKLTFKDFHGESKDEMEKRDFIKAIKYSPLKSEDYGKEFTYKGEEFKLVHYRPKARKYKYGGKSLETGKVYYFLYYSIFPSKFGE